MSLISKYFAGEDSQGHWIGVVESRQDPLELGRLRVRMYGVHSPSLKDIPTEHLPWAQTLQGMSGKQFSTPKETEVVFGIWLDNSKQIPLVLGVVPGFESNPPNLGSGFHDLRSESVIVLAPKIPVGRVYNTDGSGIIITEANTANATVIESLRHPNADELNKLSISGVGRYQNLANTVIAARKNNLDKNIQSANNFKWSEPYPAYNPEYPYDNATVTESGHIIEYDDTPGSERIHIAHRSGSFIEWYPTGSKVEKITKSNYQIVMADDYIHVMGKVAISVDGDCLVRVKGDTILESGGKLSANVAGDIDFSVGGGFNVQAKTINLSASEDVTLIGDSVFVTGSSSLDITSPKTSIGSDGDLNLYASGQAAMQGSSVGISGSVQINGLTSVNQGAPSATAPNAGSSAGIPSGMGSLTKNTGEATPEEVPIPFNIQTVQLDPITGAAYVERLFLTPGANNTVANNNLVAPDSNVVSNTANCQYDITTKTLLGDPSTWAISDKGLALIEAAEGFAKVTQPDTVVAYPDPATGGEPLTIGYGTTAAALGQPITAGMTISRAIALEYLGTCIESAFLPTLQKNIKVPITQAILDALMSFIYNVGSANFLKSSVLRNLNKQDYCSAANSLLLWNTAAKKVLPGLTTRRQKEKALFLS